ARAHRRERWNLVIEQPEDALRPEQRGHDLIRTIADEELQRWPWQRIAAWMRPAGNENGDALQRALRHREEEDVLPDRPERLGLEEGAQLRDDDRQIVHQLALASGFGGNGAKSSSVPRRRICTNTFCTPRSFFTRRSEASGTPGGTGAIPACPCVSGT